MILKQRENLIILTIVYFNNKIVITKHKLKNENELMINKHKWWDSE